MEQEEIIVSQTLQQSKEKARQKKYSDLDQLIKQVKISDTLQLHHYVDVFDSYNSWRNGYILEIIKSEELQIRFDGWSQKYDETHKMNSSKLSYFRSHAEPYTGATHTAIRDFTFERGVDPINKAIEKFQLISIQQFQDLDPKLITQFLRGEVYFLLDSILQESGSLKEDEIRTSIDFIESFIRFFISWMDQITEQDIMLDYIEGKTISNLTYYFDTNVGIVSCFPEFLDILNSIFYGGTMRTKKFYQQNEIYFNRVASTQGIYASTTRDRSLSSQPQIQSFINYFGNNGGLEKMSKLMKFSYGDQTTIKQRIPFSILKSILPVLETLGQHLSPKFRVSYFLEIKDTIFERLQNLTLYDLKDQHMNTMLQVIKKLPQALYWVPNINQEVEQLEVRLALSFIRSQFLDKKVRGVKELTDIIEKTSKNIMMRYDGEIKLRYFNEASLANFLVDERIFELLLTEAGHVEVFKRAAPVLKFMIEQTEIKVEQLDVLWASTQKKHENDQKAAYDTICELSKVMSVEAKDYLFEKIMKVPVEEYDNLFLHFLKDFTINAVNNSKSNSKGFTKSQKHQQVYKYEFYGVPLLWNMILDNSPLNVTQINTAINSFINCIKLIKSEKEKYIQLCLANLKTNQSVPQSLYVAQNTIDSYGPGGSWRGEGSEDLLSRILKEYNLVELIIQDLEKYVKVNVSAGITDTNQAILNGKLDHPHNIQYRLDFLEYLNSQLPKKIELSMDQFKRLWQSLVINPVSDSDKTFLLDLLIKQSTTKYSLLRESQFDDLFRISFSQPTLLAKLNMQLYKSIEKFFMNINQKNQSINLAKSLIRVIKFDSICGVDFFWSVLLYCPHEDVVQQACNMLVNVYLRTEKLSQTDARLAMWQNFFTRCKDVLKQTGTDMRSKGNFIRCLKGLLTLIDGKKYLVGNEPAKQMVKFTVQLGKDEKTLRTLSLPANYTFLEMRRFLGKEFSLGQQDFELYFANYDVKLAPESEEDYSVVSVEEARIRDKTDVIIQGVSQSPHPGFVCVNKLRSSPSNWEVAEVLFELLQSASDSYFDDIWEVLTLLPQNKQIKQQIESLKTDGSEEQWNRILHFTCQRKLLYCLQIVESIVQEKIANKWSLDFVKTRGLYWLLQYYSKMGINTDFTVIFNLKCFAQISRIISYFVKNYLHSHIQYFDSNQSQQKILTDIGTKSLNYIVTFFDKVQNKSYQDNSTILDFINNLMELVQLTLFISPSISQALIPFFPCLIQKGLIDFQDQGTRKTLHLQLLSIIKEQEGLQTYLLQYISETFSKSTVLLLKDQVAEYMSLIGGLLLLIHDPNTQIPFTQQIIDIIIQCSQQEDYEAVLGAAFKLMSGAINASKQAQKMIISNNQLAKVIIQDCLFQLPNQNSITLAHIQQSEHRKEGYTLLLLLIENKDSFSMLMKLLQQYVDASYWRTNSYQNWNVTQVSQQKSRTGFVGLKNLGCTCYMNSLLQQLFTLPHFRDAVLQVPLEPKPSSVLYQFQILLSALKSSQKQYYDPRAICNVLGPDGSPINFMEQMDVDEFWSGFMDKLENELKPLRKDMIIKRNFGGLLSNELICKGCPHQSSREELFLALPLQVKNKKSILESLQTMTEGEMLEGDNAYFCEKCEKKIPTLMRVCIKKLPNVLLCVLKRFEFNFETLTKFKLNDYCEFPMKLDMRPYTREYLEANERSTDRDEDAAPLDLPEYPPEYYEYSLRGVILHQGTADSGHYYSLIQDGTQQWFEFNDTVVKPFDLSELGSTAFGVDGVNNNQSSSNGMMRDRYKNAYMVFYERSVYFDDSGKALRLENEVNWFFNRGESLAQPEDSSVAYNKEILWDNLKYQVSKVMFERSFWDFSYGLLTNESLEAGIYCLQFFLSVVIRSQDRKDLPRYLRSLKRLLRNNLALSQNLLEAFLAKESVLEFIIFNSVIDMKYIIVGLLGVAISCVSQQIDSRVPYANYKQESQNAKLSVLCLHLLWDLRNDTRRCDQLYRLMSLLVSSSKNAKNLFLRHKAIGRILFFFLEEPPLGAGYQDLGESVKEFQPQNHILKLNKVLLDNEAPTVVQQSSMWDIQNNNYTYLVLTLSELTQAVDFQIDDDETTLLEDHNVIHRLLGVSYTRKARRALGQLFESRLRTEGEDIDFWERTQQLVVAVYQFLKDCEERELKAGLVALAAMASVHDAYEEQRCQLIAEVFVLILKDGLNYWFCTEIVLDYIIKSCSYNHKLMVGIQVVLDKNKSVLKLIENWIKESFNPYNHFQQQRWKIFRKRNTNIFSSEITGNLKWFQERAILRNNLLIKQIMSHLAPQPPIYDSDEELDLSSMEVGQKIDAIYPTRPPSALCYDFSGYSNYLINDTMEDMIELKPLTDTKQPMRWFFFDDDSLAKSGTAIKRYGTYINFLK